MIQKSSEPVPRREYGSREVRPHKESAEVEKELILYERAYRSKIES